MIALTADAIVGARENYLKEGFSDYLSKPVMYEALEEMLLKYLSPELIRTLDETVREKEEDASEEDKPIVIAISPSSDRLRTLKEQLGGSCKGVFVKDMAAAAKFIEKNKYFL